MKLSQMSERIQLFFHNNADCMARATQFVRRASKMTGSYFLQMMVFEFLQDPKASLNELAAFCQAHLGFTITPQGIDERIGPAALAFLKTMCTLALKLFCHQAHVPIPLLTQFSAVNITDSTSISLPPILAHLFPGCGGDASPAGLKIQVVLELLSGTFSRLWLTDGITPDQKATQHLNVAIPGSLNLFDLGYFTLANLQALAEAGAFFLCRLLLQTNLYRDDGRKVNLLALLRAETRNRFEFSFRLGKALMIPCRLCCFRAPDEVANRRRQKANAQAAKQGRTPSKLSLELMGWTLLVTNVPASMLSLDHVALLYAVRWQIELLFKLWKSHLKLHRITSFRKERVLVELYAKLIGAILFQFLAMPLRAKNLDLSPTKAFKRLAKQSTAFVEALRSIPALITILERLLDSMRTFAMREKRKTRLTTHQQLLEEVAYYP